MNNHSVRGLFGPDTCLRAHMYATSPSSSTSAGVTSLGLWRRCSALVYISFSLQVSRSRTPSKSLDDSEKWAASTARLIGDLNEAEAEVLQLRDLLRRSEAELEKEREERRLTEEDNAIERQLRYQVEGDIENFVVRAVESERRCERLTEDAKRYTYWNTHIKAKYEAMQRTLRKLRDDKQDLQWMMGTLTDGVEDLVSDLYEHNELSRLIPWRRRLRIQRWIQEAHREMMLQRQMSREGTPPR